MYRVFVQGTGGVEGGVDHLHRPAAGLLVQEGRLVPGGGGGDHCHWPLTSGTRWPGFPWLFTDQVQLQTYIYQNIPW